MEPYRRSLWLIDLLSRETLNREEIAARWQRSSINEEGEIYSRRTFNRDKVYIAQTFQLEIRYVRSSNNYTLDNPELIKQQSLLQYSIEQNRMLGLTKLSHKMQKKIYLEPLQTGSEYLQTMLDAIDQGVTVKFDYHTYYQPDQLKQFELIPCFVRYFERRWYLIGETIHHKQPRVLALERMRNVTPTTQKRKPSEAMSPEVFYVDCFGIIHDENAPQWITLKVYQPQVNYVRSTPIHPSQEEIETQKDYSIFRIFVRPSYDLVQHLLWNRDRLEVIAPQSLREEMCTLLKNMLDLYTKAP